MLYGRFATSLRGGGSSAARSRRSASPQWTSVRGMPVEVRLEPAVDLDRVDVRDALGEEARQHAEPGPDLEHDVGGVELGEPLDHAEDVLVDQEVLAEALARRDASQAEDLVALRVDLRLELGRVDAARLGERGERVHDVRRLVRAGRAPACGARYGLSVSASRRSAGTRRAAARRS